MIAGALAPHPPEGLKSRLLKILTRRWILFAALLLAVIAAGYVLAPVGNARISQEACENIQLGWSENQVEELLGGSDFRIPHVGMATVMGAQGRVRDFSSVMQWTDEGGNLIMVIFDGKRGVIEKGFAASNLSLVERVKRRVSRRIRAILP
jgi:hypothetical protein